jgi:heme-degrading monooxygenase HmoA
MITRFVKLTFKEDKIEDFKKIWNESRKKIAAFDGCSFVEMHQARVPDNVCFTHSIWESEDALNAYRHSELFQKTWAKTKILFDDKPEAWSLNTHGYEGRISK